MEGNVTVECREKVSACCNQGKKVFTRGVVLWICGLHHIICGLHRATVITDTVGGTHQHPETTLGTKVSENPCAFFWI